MTAADELRAAAALLTERAAGATSGPWTVPREIAVRAPVPDDEDGWTHADSGGLAVVVQAQHFEGTRDLVRKRSAADLAWIAMLNPLIAAPLAELLTAAAEMQEIAEGAYESTRRRAYALLGPEPARPAPAQNVARALAVARVVNGGAS